MGAYPPYDLLPHQKGSTEIEEGLISELKLSSFNFIVPLEHTFYESLSHYIIRLGGLVNDDIAQNETFEIHYDKKLYPSA